MKITVSDLNDTGRFQLVDTIEHDNIHAWIPNRQARSWPLLALRLPTFFLGGDNSTLETYLFAVGFVTSFLAAMLADCLAMRLLPRAWQQL